MAYRNKFLDRITLLVNIKSTAPFQIITVDFLHLDKCRGEYEYILVVTDHFTRFAQALPTKNNRAKTTADKIFNEVVLKFGFPDQIHYDQGGEFVNKIWMYLQKLSGIKASKTTPYHPMGNSQCERMIRTLLNMLKTLDKYQKKNWKDHIKHLIWSYNNTKHKATKFSPHFLMFGRYGRLPIDLMFNRDNGNDFQSYDEYVDCWKESMQEAHRIASEKSDLSNRQGKKFYDNRARGKPIDIGDRVLVRNLTPRGGTTKLNSHWEEKIYVVTDKRQDIPIFKVKPVDSSGKERILHRNLLIKCNQLSQIPSTNQ